ncbi:MAG: hybrid sensor histidine kinase/response regulator [Isosphaeraceae bacterium]
MPEARRHTFLIVDDEPDVLESLRHLFHRRYRVLTATDGAEAIALLEGEEVHIILSDQRMPGMTGDGFLARAREIQPDAVRMLFTGYADIQAVISSINRGQIFRFILKPWDVQELEGIVRQAAEQYDLIADRRHLMAELQQANARLVRANADLAESDALKTAFLEVASHEFNTPINLVSGLTELLRLIDPERPAEEAEILEQLNRASRQLARLVATTLTLMEADDFRRTIRREPTDLAELLQAVADQVRPFVRARHQELSVEIDADLGEFDVDADKIRDAVVNLLTNAVKFTPDGCRIAIQAGLIGPDEAEIRVIDNGAGLTERAIGRLFRPFFTEFDPSRHSSGDFGYNKRGLGLGLSLVRKFVELHQGTVRAGGEPGRGAVFTITLPRRAAATAYTPSPETWAF